MGPLQHEAVSMESRNTDVISFMLCYHMNICKQWNWLFVLLASILALGRFGFIFFPELILGKSINIKYDNTDLL